MEDAIIKIIGTQSIFAMLFIYLLFNLIKEGHKREDLYHNLIQKLINIIEQNKDNENS